LKIDFIRLLRGKFWGEVDSDQSGDCRRKFSMGSAGPFFVCDPCGIDLELFIVQGKKMIFLIKNRSSLFGLAAVAVLVSFLLSGYFGLTQARAEPFVWKQDGYWQGLEVRYQELQKGGCQDAMLALTSQLQEAHTVLQQISQMSLEPEDPLFLDLERQLFELGPVVGRSRYRGRQGSGRSFVHK
jgi:hypothetical protein